MGLFLKEEKYGELEAFLSVINDRKEESNRALVASLHDAGYDIHYQEIRERHQGNINRAVIAAELLKKGYIREIKEAFQGVLSPKCGFYTPPERIPAAEAVRYLHSIHAVPVLAHPFISSGNSINNKFKNNTALDFSQQIVDTIKGVLRA